jgi:hypothetical protein
MGNFQDELHDLVDKWVAQGDDPESMISDLESEIARLKVAKRHKPGDK